MNYKVMQRPMFKMGGKAASQGTGITSGLDEKVNMTDGRVNYSTGPTTYQDFLDRALKNYNLRQKKMADMNELINLQALGKVSNVIGQTESNNPLDIIREIAVSGAEIALPALSAKKAQELKILDPSSDLAFAKILKPDGRGFSTKLKSLSALKSLQDNINKLQGSITAEMSQTEKSAISNKIADLREQKRIFLSGNPELQAAELYFKYDLKGQTGALPNDEDLEKYRKFTGGNAAGGMPNRVNRAMGSGDDGELPADPTEPVNPFKPKPIKPLGDGKMAFDDTPGFELKSLDALINEFEADNGKKPVSIDDLKRYFLNKYGPGFISKINQAVANESKDVAMETKGQGNNVYDMLRTRLPQEISDEVVKLIAYNKEAFGDFASIKNQEDVTSFNEKYGVELVIDVATV